MSTPGRDGEKNYGPRLDMVVSLANYSIQITKRKGINKIVSAEVRVGERGAEILGKVRRIM